MKNKIHVAVLMGGYGDEKEVSINSGKACSLALTKANYRVSKILVNDNLLENIKTLKPDICFNALHGKFGEDGTIQGFFETIKQPYTHSDVMTSSTAMNKILTKSLLKYYTKDDLNPIKFPKNLTIKNFNDYLPIIVKPVFGGSSVGIKIIEKPNQIKNAADFFSNENLFVEPLVGNTELTVTVLKNKPLTVSEIITDDNSKFYDYNSKYDDKGSKHIIPARIPKNIFKKTLKWAKKAHEILGCRGISRSDFRYDNINNKLYMLEINTQPGMTNTSHAPEQAKFIGLSMSDLVDLLIKEGKWEF